MAGTGNSLLFLLEGEDRSAAAFDGATRSIKKVDDSTKSLRETFRDVVVITTGVTRAIKSITGGFTDLLRAAENQVNVEIQLAVALRKTTDDVEGAVAAIKEFASQRQAVTTFGDETTLALAKVGAEFGLTTRQILEAVPAIQDRAIQATRAPLDMMRIFAKSIVGISEGWAELGVSIDKTLPKQEKFNEAIRQMRSGVSEAIGRLPTSAFTQLSNSLGDLQEALGKVIVSTKTFQTIVGFVRGKVDQLNEAIGSAAGIRAIAGAIDGFVEGVVRGFAKLGAEVLFVTADVLSAIGKIQTAITKLVAFFDGDLSKSIQFWTDRMDRARSAIGELRESNKANTAEMNRAVAEMMTAKDVLADLGIQVLDLGAGVRETARDLDRWQATGELFSASAKTIGDAMADVIATFSKGAEAPARASREQVAAFSETIMASLAEFETIGSEFTSAFSNAVQGAFDRDVGVREAFRNLGDDVRRTFIGQFSDAAFDPLKAQFGVLAKALAQPFEIVGQVVARILAPITNLVVEVISTLVGKLFALVGAQEIVAATGVAGVVAVNAAATSLAGAWGAAATAAAIATLGAALAAAPAAQAAIVAGAAQTRALSIGLAEGAVVLPRPGGVPATIAEGGEAELVAPLSRLPELMESILSRAGGGLLGFGGGLNVTIAGGLVTEQGAERFVALLSDELGVELDRGRDVGRTGAGVL